MGAALFSDVVLDLGCALLFCFNALLYVDGQLGALLLILRFGETLVLEALEFLRVCLVFLLVGMI